jgi:linoleoyl-CoA desaturase
MKKLKFTPDEGTAFYKELQELVNHYFVINRLEKSGNQKMIFKIFFYLGLDLLFYVLMITSTSIIAFYTFYVLLGIAVLLTAFNISHDAAHGVAVKNKFWNQFLFSLSFNLLGNNAYVWGKNHVESHHLYTNVEGSDIDVLNNPLVRMTENQPLRWFHRYQRTYVPILYLFYTINWFFLRETLMLFSFSSRTIKINIPRNEVLKLIVYKLFYIGYMLVIPIYVLPFGWEMIGTAFIISHFVISIFFVSVLTVAHLSDFVEHPIPNSQNRLGMSWPKLQLVTSVDYHAESGLLNFVLGGFNAHAVHHLLPNICHVHYPRIVPIFKLLAKKHGLNYMEMSYFESLKAHFRFLKLMGTQKSFKTVRYER